jgi:ABC-type nitrate/sulfonate/bicarbonate transport system permease component
MSETSRHIRAVAAVPRPADDRRGDAPRVPQKGWLPQAELRRPPGHRRVFTRRSISRRERWVIGTLSVLGVVGLWQLLSSEAVIDPLIASSPAHVVSRGIALAQDGTLGPAVSQSAKLFAIGFGVSLGTGLLIGILIGWYPRAEAALDPFISVLYAVPRIALVPLVMVWAGLGFRSQVIIVWTTAVFPIIINTAVGVGGLDRNLIAVARSFRASSLDVLRTIALPGAVPAILAGVRQAVALALIGVVVAEYFVGNNGLGGMIVNAGQTVDTAAAYVGVVIFAASAIILNVALKFLERRWSRWRS